VLLCKGISKNKAERDIRSRKQEIESKKQRAGKNVPGKAGDKERYQGKELEIGWKDSIPKAAEKDNKARRSYDTTSSAYFCHGRPERQ
jgi:hypothetical protein